MTFEFSLRKDETPETEPGVKIVILRLEAIMDMGERRVFGLEMSFFDFLNDKSGEGWMSIDCGKCCATSHSTK